MSIRLTDRIIGEIVIAKGLPKSPLMIAKSYDIEANLLTTTWFSDNNEHQEGAFPPKALDKAEPKQAKTASKPAARNKKK